MTVPAWRPLSDVPFRNPQLPVLEMPIFQRAQPPPLSSSPQPPWTVQPKRRSGGGETLLTQKSVTDKSEQENDLFCHSPSGSGPQVCLFIFISKHESHFQRASRHSALGISQENVTISFSLGSFIFKRRKPEGRAGPSTTHPSPPTPLRCSLPTSPLSAPAFPTASLVLTRGNWCHAKISGHRHSSAGFDIRN